MTAATLVAPSRRSASPATPKSRPTYDCPACGHLLRVSGLGRHRVYFELGDERSADPVMTSICPACGRGLPGKNRPRDAAGNAKAGEDSAVGDAVEDASGRPAGQRRVRAVMAPTNQPGASPARGIVREETRSTV